LLPTRIKHLLLVAAETGFTGYRHDFRQSLGFW